MLQTKYFLDPICGYGNMVDVYIENRLPEIIDEFDSKEDAIKYICENEVYLFNYKNEVDTLEAKLFLERYNAFNTHVYFIDWKEDRKNVKDYFKLIEQKLIEENFKNIDENGMPKFDYIIQNPPYKHGLHLKFLEESLSILSKTGKMIIIEPSNWLIKLNNTIRTKQFDIIKEKIYKHIKLVIIENLNNEFKISQGFPLSIVTIDFSKTYDKINFICCGENKTVNSIYDCNLIGNYMLIQSIFNKCKSYKNMMLNHIYKQNKNIENKYFVEYHANLGTGIMAARKRYYKAALLKNSNDTTSFENNMPIQFKLAYSYKNKILNKLPHKVANGSNGKNKKYTNKIQDCIIGTKNELINWNYFIYNNSLPQFLNICLTIDATNALLEFTPWLVDKKRTDEEIYSLLGFTNEEIKLIESTIKKFWRTSEWFKRLQCGPSMSLED